MVHGQCHARCPPILPRSMALTSFRWRAHQRAWLSIQRTATELHQIPTWARHWCLLTRNQVVGGLPERAKGVSAGAQSLTECAPASTLEMGSWRSSIFALCHSAFCFLVVVVAAKLHPEISHTAPRVGVDLCPKQDVELLVVLSNTVPLALCLRLANSSRPLTTEPFSRAYYQARSAETLSVRRSLAPQPTGCFTHLLAYM